MVVPGGPAYKTQNGKRVEKLDTVLAIDPDGKVRVGRISSDNPLTIKIKTAMYSNPYLQTAYQSQHTLVHT